MNHDPQSSGRRETRALGAGFRHSLVGSYLELGKAGLSAFVVMTTLVGFVLAGEERASLAMMAATAAGTGLLSSGALALNQWIERRRDARMRRTEGRPIPAGRIAPRMALVVALISAGMGSALLWLLAGRLTAWLGLACALIYLLVYTPLKARSPLCTLVGAICGAIPPLMGWAAASGRLAPGAWVLAATLFVWQIPHFLALGWLYRGDYERGGFRMLTVTDREGTVTAQMSFLYIVALIPIGIGASLVGLAGVAFLFGSFLLGLGLLVFGLRLYLSRSDADARRLFIASLIYLPLLLGLMLVDRGG